MFRGASRWSRGRDRTNAHLIGIHRRGQGPRHSCGCRRLRERGRPLVVTDRSDSACVLLGMAELHVVAVTEENDEQHVRAETEVHPVGCPTCGTRAESKGRRTSRIRDLEIAGRPTVLWWKKRRWCCNDPDCPNKTWTETVAGIAPRAVLSDRARAEIARRIGEEARPVAEVARSFGVAWDTAWRAFEAAVTPRIEDPGRIGGVRALGVDETAFLAATKDHPRVFATGMVDVRRGILVDIIEGRSAAILSEWLGERPTDWLGRIEVVTIDPLAAYRAGLRPHLAHATVVADPFHIVRLANKAI